MGSKYGARYVHQEECAGAKAMIDHLKHASSDTFSVQCKHPEHTEAKVSNGTVGHQFFYVPLSQSAQGSIDDSNNRQEPYDWKSDLSDEEILEKYLSLNLERAKQG